MVLPPAYYFYAFADEEKHVFVVCMIQGLFFEFCYGVYNQCESFICLDLIVKSGRYILRGILIGGPVLN